MKILAVDVGLKNLSLCCIDNTYNVFLWETYDLLSPENQECQGLVTENVLCGKKSGYIVPRTELPELFVCKKHLPKNCSFKKLKEFKVKDLLLQEIAYLIQSRLEKIYTNTPGIHELDKIVIELQPCINQKMKFVSHILFGQFVKLYGTGIPIRFVSASKKLKFKYFKTEFYNTVCKDTYNLKKYQDRKKACVEYTKWVIGNKLCNTELLEKFVKHSKLDDLSDTWAMAMNEI